MAVLIWRTKMWLHTEFEWIALYFLMVLDIFNDESENSTLRNKKMAEPKWPTKN